MTSDLPGLSVKRSMFGCVPQRSETFYWLAKNMIFSKVLSPLHTHNLLCLWVLCGSGSALGPGLSWSFVGPLWDPFWLAVGPLWPVGPLWVRICLGSGPDLSGSFVGPLCVRPSGPVLFHLKVLCESAVGPLWVVDRRCALHAV